jgi:hypothetical protein
MAKQQTSDILKEFGLSDDDILKIATEPRLTDATNLLILAIWDKWNMTRLQAMDVVKSLKKEFE